MKPKLWGPLAPLTLGMAVIAFGLDQLHKYWMLEVYDIAGRAPVRITKFLDLVMVWNTGVSYGLFSTHVQQWLVALSVGIAILLWIWACGVRGALAAAALGLVIGGALGNAADRLTRGAVADFFLFHYQQFNWYVFNVADVAIVVGVGLLMYESFVTGERGKRRGKA